MAMKTSCYDLTDCLFGLVVLPQDHGAESSAAQGALLDPVPDERRLFEHLVARVVGSLLKLFLQIEPKLGAEVLCMRSSSL